MIGECILNTTKNIKGIFLKADKLNNLFRTPKLEHLDGSDNKIVNVIDNGLKITFDIE